MKAAQNHAQNSNIASICVEYEYWVHKPGTASSVAGGLDEHAPSGREQIMSTIFMLLLIERNVLYKARTSQPHVDA